MIEKVIDHINSYKMLEAQDRVIVALSGGPDSMCLLHMLHSLKDRYNIKLYAAHVNHCLRGLEADEDEIYVKNFCEEYNIEFYSRKIDINKEAKRKGVSTETAGREARYEYFEELKSRLNADKIALAHNLNDQAETLLMRIIRGTGMEGLNGIRPVRDDIYIRPILNLSREEIESYCEDFNLKPRIDKTNFENIYNRNKIRLELIPYIQENFNKDIVTTLSRLSYIIGKDNEYLDVAAEEKYREYCSSADKSIIIDKSILEEKEAILSRVFRKAILNLTGSLNNIEMKHIQDIIGLLKGGTGKSINLPRSIVGENIYGNIHIYISKDKAKKSENKERSEIVLCKESIFNNDNKVKISLKSGVTISLELINSGNNISFRGASSYIAYFDFDEIGSKISIRYRRDGDKFKPLGMRGSKKLKDLFIDLKIPKDDRDKIPLICFDDEIVWIVGYRVSNNYLVNKNTQKMLVIKICKGEN